MAPTASLLALVSAAALFAIEGRRTKFGATLRRLVTSDAPSGDGQQGQQSKTKWRKRKANQRNNNWIGEGTGSSGRSQKKLFKGGVSMPVNLANDVRCYKYEMCQCELGETERNTKCKENTCVLQPIAPLWCSKDNAECEFGKTNEVNWAHCEFANTQSTNFYPGEDNLFVDLRPAQPAADETPASGNQVLVDVDDTIKCSGGMHKGGVLSDCEGAGTESGGVFPGAVAFFYALALGDHPYGKFKKEAEYKNNKMPKLRKPIPYTARPGELKLILGLEKSVSSLIGSGKALREDFRSHGPNYWRLDVESAKYGKLLDLLDVSAVVGHRGTDATQYDQMAYRKFSSYKRMYNEEYKKRGIKGSFFVGDNGQGDLVAAQMMLQYGSKSKPGIKAAFIHDALRQCKEECMAKWASFGIYVFKDYPHAASIALRQKFITPEARDAVCDKARGFDCTATRDPDVKQGGSQQDD